MKQIAAAGLCSLLVTSVIAQTDSLEQRYAASITREDLREHLELLAGDSLEGRETGAIGQRRAAQYIMEQFRAFGIPPIPDSQQHGLMANGYQQQFPLVLSRLGGISMKVGGKQYGFLKDFCYFTEALQTGLEAGEVMVLTPRSLGGVRLGGASPVVLLLDANGGDQRLLTEQAKKTLEGTQARVLLMVDDSAAWMMRKFGPYLAHGRMQLANEPAHKADGPQEEGLQVLVVTPKLAQAILDNGHLSRAKAGKLASKKRLLIRVPVEFAYASRNERLNSENVLGFVEGGDMKNEVVVVTAHYDHIGVIDGEVHNGADDDGSGTVAVLEMAQAFALAKAEGHGPRRSLLFMAVSGEEKGLLGSAWYAQNPVFPLDSTVADLNIDMIGRTDSVHGDSSRYVYVIGSRRISAELGDIIEQKNTQWTGLDLDYTFDAENDPNRFYYRSDHYNFAKHGVPIAFFFNGVHADYHGPYDEVDKIRFDLLQQRTLLVFHTAWELANREDRILKNGPEGRK